jgi:hypothetical protein
MNFYIYFFEHAVKVSYLTLLQQVQMSIDLFTIFTLLSSALSQYNTLFDLTK